MATIKDLCGIRFGKVVVVERAGSTSAGQATWKCQCDCGIEKAIRGADLRNGHTTSCGCYGQMIRSAAGVKARNGHGMSRKPIYAVWSAMKERCQNTHHRYYKDYGGRGIKVCERWEKFENFFADMGDVPTGLTLDRYPNNNGNYDPTNCRWSTWEQQQNNRRDTIKIKFDGETLSVAQWARRIGISAAGLRYRLSNDWPMAMALTFPPEMNRKI